MRTGPICCKVFGFAGLDYFSSDQRLMELKAFSLKSEVSVRQVVAGESNIFR